MIELLQINVHFLGSEELVPPVESREKFFGGSFTVPSAYNVTQAESGLASA